MKKIIFLVALTLGYMSIYAQNRSDFDTVPSADKTEVIYKGQCSLEDISKVTAFHLAEKAAAYKPSAKAMEVLKNELKNYQLIIFLGTWCEDSHYLIPQLYKVLEESGYPLDTLTVYAVDRDKKAKNKEEETFSITNVPTIIVSHGGKETGRITETAKKSIEQDLADIITKK